MPHNKHSRSTLGNVPSVTRDKKYIKMKNYAGFIVLLGLSRITLGTFPSVDKETLYTYH